MKKKLLIIGAGGHGRVVAEIAKKTNKWKNIHFLDDNENITKNSRVEIIDTIDNFNDYIDDYDMFVAMGNNAKRKEILTELEKKEASIPIILHPRSIIGEEVNIGRGTVVMPGVVISSFARVGKGCIINTGTTIDHDSIIEDYVHLSPGVNIAGTVTVGAESWLGIGSVVINNITITPKCIIGAGAVVIKDLLESGTYIGVPAKKSN